MSEKPYQEFGYRKDEKVADVYFITEKDPTKEEDRRYRVTVTADEEIATKLQGNLMQCEVHVHTDMLQGCKLERLQAAVYGKYTVSPLYGVSDWMADAGEELIRVQRIVYQDRQSEEEE